MERGSDLIGALPPKLFASCKLEDYGIATRLSLSLFRRSPSSSFASVFHPLLLPEIPDNATVLETEGPRECGWRNLARHSMCELRRLSLPSSSTYPRACKTLHKNEFDLNVDTDWDIGDAFNFGNLVKYIKKKESSETIYQKSCRILSIDSLNQYDGWYCKKKGVIRSIYQFLEVIVFRTIALILRKWNLSLRHSNKLLLGEKKVSIEISTLL